MLAKFKAMDMKQKVIIIGGTILVFFLMARAIFSKVGGGSSTPTSSGAVPSQDANDIAQALASSNEKSMNALQELLVKQQQADKDSMDKLKETLTAQQLKDKEAYDKQLEASKNQAAAQLDSFKNILSGYQENSQKTIETITSANNQLKETILNQQQQNNALNQQLLNNMNKPITIDWGGLDLSQLITKNPNPVTGGTTVSYDATVAQMKQNAAAWAGSSAAERTRLEAANQALGVLIGANYNSQQGVWYTSGGSQLFSISSPAPAVVNNSIVSSPSAPVVTAPSSTPTIPKAREDAGTTAVKIPARAAAAAAKAK